MRGLGRLTFGWSDKRRCWFQERSRRLLHTSTPAGARRALMRVVEASPAVLALQRREKPDRRPQTRSQASSTPTSSLRSQLRMTPTLRTPMNEPSGELERPGFREWSRNDRVLPDDERHEPHAKEDPDVTARPTGPERRRCANTPMSDVKRECAQRPPKHPRTCNKLRPVDWLTD